jgi:lactoylglutathione lyase
MISIRKVDHIGIRVKDLDRALEFYRVLGFELHWKDRNDAVAIIKNGHDVEINLIYNATTDYGGKNILMDAADKYPGFTHVALQVDSIKAVLATLREHNIRITQGPVSLGGPNDVSVFVRDPDSNVIELRGRDQAVSELGAQAYQPQN